MSLSRCAFIYIAIETQFGNLIHKHEQDITAHKLGRYYMCDTFT